MTPLEEFIDIMHTPDGVPSPSLVSRLRNEYPFFTLPAAILLSRGGSMLDREEADRLRAFVALNSSDPSVLYRLTGSLGREFADFYGESDTAPLRPDTSDAIDTFLDRYGKPEDPEETALLERLIFHPVADYASQLAAAEKEENNDNSDSSTCDDSPEALSRMIADINQPAETDPTPEPQPTQRHTASLAPPDTTFSESLAKIYIRQHKYDKALEIISNLNLKYPEKSCYFADQMRFLQKLILNKRYNI